MMERTGDPRPYILSPPRVGLGAAAPARHDGNHDDDSDNDGAVVGDTRLAVLLWPSTSAAGPGPGSSTGLPGFVPLYSEVLPHADQEVRLAVPDDDPDTDGLGYDWPGAGMSGGDGDYDLPDDDPQVGVDWAALAAGTADTAHSDGTSDPSSSYFLIGVVALSLSVSQPAPLIRVCFQVGASRHMWRGRRTPPPSNTSSHPRPFPGPRTATATRCCTTPPPSTPLPWPGACCAPGPTCTPSTGATTWPSSSPPHLPFFVSLPTFRLCTRFTPFTPTLRIACTRQRWPGRARHRGRTGKRRSIGCFGGSRRRPPQIHQVAGVTGRAPGVLRRRHCARVLQRAAGPRTAGPSPSCPGLPSPTYTMP